MHVAKKDIPVKISAPGAVARLLPGFGEAKGNPTLSAEFFSMAAGTDIAPLLQGLEGDACQAPHWGYLAQGQVQVRYSNGSTEEINAGDLFYWPPGHTVRVEKDAELLMFSPQHEHLQVLEHMQAKMG